MCNAISQNHNLAVYTSYIHILFIISFKSYILCPLKVKILEIDSTHSPILKVDVYQPTKSLSSLRFLMSPHPNTEVQKCYHACSASLLYVFL